MSVRAPLREAADSLAKASTPEPFSKSRTSNWVARGGGLPAYIQHIAHDLMEKRGKSESNAIQMAIGIVKRWARGGGNVDSGTRAAAAKAVAEWIKLKAGNAAKKVGKAIGRSQESWLDLEPVEPSLADELAVRDAALLRVSILHERFGDAGLIALMGATLQEAAAPAFEHKLTRTAAADQEIERHDVEHGGQTVGSLARRKTFDGRGDMWQARSVNGSPVGERSPSKGGAIDALRKHLEDAPARVVPMAKTGKYLVARPSSYGQTTYSEFPSEGAARHAAGLPAGPTAPEKAAQVEGLGESLIMDLMTVSGQDIPPLSRVQEARCLVPLAELFDPAELRGFHGRWIRGGAPSRISAAGKELPLFLGGKRTASVRRELGSFRDTREKYGVMKGGKLVYSSHRSRFHRGLIEKLFEESGAKTQRPGERHAVFVAGGPASGKSSAEAYMPQHPNSVEIDQDYFKNKIDEFTRLAKEHDPYASDAAHRESADIAHQARLEAMRRGYNVVVQGVGDSGPGQFAKKLVESNAQGYRTHAFYVSAPTPIAMERAKARAASSGRAVPEAGLRSMHANASRRFREVLRTAAPHLESLQVFDSREDTKKGGQARRLAYLNPATRKLVIENERLYREFLAKEKEHHGRLIRAPHYV